MTKRTVVLAFAAWLAVSPALLRAQDASPDLAAGIHQVEEGDYAAAVITLDRAARGLAEQKEKTHDLARAYLYLGIAYVGLGSETSARARFRDALAQSGELRLDPEQFPPKVIELFEKAREESRAVAPASSPAPRAAPSAAPASTGKGKSKLPIILIGVGAAAAGGVALAAGGASKGTSGTASTPPTATMHTDMLSGSVSGGCGSDTTTFRFVPSAAGTLDATLAWTDRDHPIDMVLADTDSDTANILARATPASNTSARMMATVQNRAYWVDVFQAGGGPCIRFTLTLTYPQ
jgi:hypothetical protein